MSTLWFIIVAVMITIYAVLDGFDFGVGIVFLFVAQTDAEKRALLHSIGPVWDGNEVWLIAGGGTLFFAFPAAYAAGFSGFYLPLMMVLWLLILRGTAVEFRNHIVSPVWTPFWDVTFAGSSVLLALFFGAALGNVVRGVPLNGDGNFFLPLWTRFRVERDAGILDWFTITLALASIVTLMMHGALWVAMKTRGQIEERARQVADGACLAMAPITIVLFAIVPLTLPRFADRYTSEPWGLVFPLTALAALVRVRMMIRKKLAAAAFTASCGYIVAILCSAAFGHYPNLLPTIGDAPGALTIYNASASSYGLRIGLVWFVPGLLLAVAYSAFAYRDLSIKTDVTS